MAGFADFLTQGQTPPATTTDTQTGTSLPAWYNSYLSTLANVGAGIAATPYQSYGGARIAPQDPQEQQAYDYMGANATNWQGPLQQAQGAAGSVAGGFNDEQFKKYMNPYTSGVVDEIGRLGFRNLNENLMPAMNDQFIGAGQFASDRNRVMDERLARDTGADILGKQGAALSSGFNSSVTGYNQGQSNVNAAAANLGGLSQMEQGLTTGTAGALSTSGATNRGFGQANEDLAYQDFLNQVNYPRQNASFLQSMLTGSQMPTSQEQTTTAPFNGNMSPSPLATFAGMTMAGMGLNQQPQQPPRARRGGYVSSFARGGRVGGLTLARAMPTAAAPLRPRMRMGAPRGGLELMAA